MENFHQNSVGKISFKCHDLTFEKKWSLSKTDKIVIEMLTVFDPVGGYKSLVTYIGFSEFSTKKKKGVI